MFIAIWTQSHSNHLWDFSLYIDVACTMSCTCNITLWACVKISMWIQPPSPSASLYACTMLYKCLDPHGCENMPHDVTNIVHIARSLNQWLWKLGVHNITHGMMHVPLICKMHLVKLWELEVRGYVHCPHDNHKWPTPWRSCGWCGQLTYIDCMLIFLKINNKTFCVNQTSDHVGVHLCKVNNIHVEYCSCWVPYCSICKGAYA